MQLGMTVEELLKRASSRELSEWMAFEVIHGPIGYERLDYAAALIAQRVTVMLSDPKEAKKIKLDSFLPQWGREEVTNQRGDDP
jgi:hypothetical protein